MNNTSIFQKPWLLSVGLMIPTLMTLASMPANAADLGGFTNTGKDENGNTITDVQCAVNAFCASSRGGVSDVLTLFNPDKSIADVIFAFGNEETNNIYGSQAALVDPNLANQLFIALTEEGSPNQVSDVVGRFGAFLAFRSDGESPLGNIRDLPSGTLVFAETPGPNPYGYILEPGSVLTKYYDLTSYLHPDLRNAGFTAKFQSDTVPEPLTMLGAGAALGFGSFFKRKLGKNNKQDKA